MAASDERVCTVSIKNIFSDSRLKFTMIVDKGKWTEEEIDILSGCVHRLAIDLNKLSQQNKNRIISQICTTLKKKAFEDAGLSMRPGHATTPKEPDVEQRAATKLAELPELAELTELPQLPEVPELAELTELPELAELTELAELDAQLDLQSLFTRTVQ